MIGRARAQATRRLRQRELAGDRRAGSWARGEARRVQTAEGPFLGTVWAARVGGLISGSDLYLDGAGRVVSSSFLRWGDPDRTGTFALHPFGVEVTGWRTFAGVTIPHEGRVGWRFGTPRWSEGEFFRFSIERYELLAPAG